MVLFLSKKFYNFWALNNFFTLSLKIVLQNVSADTNFVLTKLSLYKNSASLQSTKFIRKSFKLNCRVLQRLSLVEFTMPTFATVKLLHESSLIRKCQDTTLLFVLARGKKEECIKITSLLHVVQINK
ncbi:hypothetical protein BpHYR1_021679 [Brachionus plicatilis]|uniref:Uncharacterized protein n=1 Tax=Brachionus plicatilis TaxID=10195 RepID=A0A3M7RVB4_BRAPC|nr:hypothetical protein BpHYR1_021679 [Brachionus plicatilis]